MGYFDERVAKALQFYSAANVTYLGYPKAGTAGNIVITIGNESRSESVTGRAPVLTTVHELTHSLRLQNDLTRRGRPTYTTDERFALNSVYEGDAVLTAQHYWQQYEPGGIGAFESRKRDTDDRSRNREHDDRA